ncbi:hypothetical protein chiPu_0008746 [Chiloscyllium punctatum]|uniref:Uncharacterized protein n=1 Tax=Chiloscyllium punctatum TaxID=137246 RepID=A0A401SIS5_CHIPU|nr:hypothetical protein [Chiloscyllium punctatum]
MRVGDLDMGCFLDTGAELTSLSQIYEPKLPLDRIVRTAYRAGADRIEIKRTKSIRLEFAPDELVTFTWVGPGAQLLLRMDIITQLNSFLHFDDAHLESGADMLSGMASLWVVTVL